MSGGILDMTGAVSMLALDVISVSRNMRTFTNGVLVLGTPVTIAMNASVQPLGASAGQSAGGRGGLAGSAGLNVDQTINGQRLYGAIVLFTTDRLYAAGEADGQQSDEITWNGKVYTVAHTEDWPTSGYWRAVATRKDA